MRNHLKMDAPCSRDRLDQMAQGVIGRPLDRPDGPLKVSGSAVYADEWDVSRRAFGVLVRANCPRGRLTGFANANEIERMAGVLAIIRDERFLRNPAQGAAGEAPLQGTRKIAYFGQPVALVVAETLEQARHAAERLDLTFEPANAQVDPSSEDLEAESCEGASLDQGNLDEAMDTAAFTIDQTYTTPSESSAAMEPLASIARWEGDELTLYGSYQMLKYNKRELADSLGIEVGKVRLLSPFVGGAFGSKLGIAPEAVAAAIAAKELSRPVAVVMTRQQVFEATMRRSESRQRIRLAADQDGHLIGIGHHSRVSTLPGETFSEPVEQSTHVLYAGEHRRFSREVVRVDLTCAGSVRAPGEAIGMLALENAMDELAVALDLDPVELRIRNIPEKNPEDGTSYSSRGFQQTLEEGAHRFGWERRRAEPGTVRDGEWLVGMGMAAAARVNLVNDSRARVTLRPDGTALVATDMTDIGTGTYAVLRQIAAEMLGLPPDSVRVELGDSHDPEGPGSGGSWGAGSSGSAVYLGCEGIRSQLAQMCDLDSDDLVLKDGKVIATGQHRTIAEVLSGQSLSCEGHFEPGNTKDDTTQGSFGAHFAEVGVNRVTGEVRVRRMLGVFDAGRILNLKTARSQCIGGMIWGIGAALTEELVHDPRDGHVVNRDFAEYHIPVNLDVPQIEVHFLQSRDEWANPIQSKGLGELGICGSGAAVTNAIYNACGARIRDYPATLDRILPHLPDL